VDAAAATTRRFVAAQDGLGEEAARALQEIAAAAEALQRLAEALERNPSSVLVGRPPAGESRR
jgi:paraquat-inducible protein B